MGGKNGPVVPAPSDVLVAAETARLGDHEITLEKIRPVRGGITVWIFRYGFIALDKNGKKVYPWAKCRLEYGRTTTKGAGGLVTMRTDTDVTVRHDNGVEFRIFGSGNQDVNAFLDHAINGVTAARLPRAYEALKTRERLDFGPVQLDLEAVYRKGKSVSWSEMNSFELEHGSVVMRQAGKWSASSVPARAITDLHVRLKVVDKIPAAPGRIVSFEEVRLRKWAQNVIAQNRLGQDDFDWLSGGPLGEVPTINDAGRRTMVQLTETRLNTRGEQVLADAAHANWGVTENIHYRTQKKRIVIVDRSASEQLVRSDRSAVWNGLVQALAARHGYAVRG